MLDYIAPILTKNQKLNSTPGAIKNQGSHITIHPKSTVISGYSACGALRFEIEYISDYKDLNQATKELLNNGKVDVHFESPFLSEAICNQRAKEAFILDNPDVEFEKIIIIPDTIEPLDSYKALLSILPLIKDWIQENSSSDKTDGVSSDTCRILTEMEVWAINTGQSCEIEASEERFSSSAGIDEMAKAQLLFELFDRFLRNTDEEDYLLEAFRKWSELSD